MGPSAHVSASARDGEEARWLQRECAGVGVPVGCERVAEGPHRAWGDLLKWRKESRDTAWQEEGRGPGRSQQHLDGRSLRTGGSRVLLDSPFPREEGSKVT